MTNRTTLHRIGIAVGSILLAWASPVHAQDGLSRAKDFYASASYEEALAVLNSLHGKTSPAETTDVARYEVFCLVALGRGDDARQAIETIVRAEPEYHLSEAEASPRVRAMFDAFRLPLLPAIARESYVKGREAFDHKDLPTALKEFDRAIALADELGPTNDQSLSDVRTLAEGFRDLGRMALASPASAAAPAGAATLKPADQAPTATAPPAASTERSPVTDARRAFGPGDTDVKPPVAISQAFPPWRPVTTVDSKRDFQGAVDLLIDEEGHVVSAAILRSVHVGYDAQLLEAARSWTFRPATKDGRPVPYRNTVAVNLVHR